MGYETAGHEPSEVTDVQKMLSARDTVLKAARRQSTNRMSESMGEAAQPRPTGPNSQPWSRGTGISKLKKLAIPEGLEPSTC